MVDASCAWIADKDTGDAATLRDVRQRDLPAAVGLLEVNRAATMERPDPDDVLVESDRGLRRTRGDIRGELFAPHVADGRLACAGVLLAPGRDVGLGGAACGRIADVEAYIPTWSKEHTSAGQSAIS